MKVAILADIHGNIHALEAVLRDLDRQRPDCVVVNGDMVNRGPNNVAVMERLASLECHRTLGNHDDLVRKWIERDGIPEDWYDDPFWKGTAVVAEALAEHGWLDALRGLPMSHCISIPGAPSVLITHGSPRHYREGYAGYTPVHCLREIIRQYPADLYVGSHSHRPFDLTLEGRRFVNTGAVGAPFNRDPRAQYLILELRDGEWHVDFRAVAYDHRAALAAFEETGYLQEGDLSAFIFYEELRLATALYDPFWRWAEAEGLPTDWQSWERFRRIFAERFVEPSPT